MQASNYETFMCSLTEHCLVKCLCAVFLNELFAAVHTHGYGWSYNILLV